MRRRRLLATIGTGAVTAVAGCAGGSDATTPTGDVPTINGRDCPPYPTDRDGAVCAHTVEPTTAAVYLDAEPTAAALSEGLPASEITLTLHNESTSDVTFNPHSWTISRWTDAGWDPLDEQVTGDGVVTLTGGETRSWPLREAVAAIRTDPALDPGLYAAEIGVPDPETEEDWLACIALLRLTRSA